VTNVLPFGPPANIERRRSVAVHVYAVVDGSIVARVVRDVRQVFRYIVGGWRVTVQTADRGRWRLELSGASGRHVWIFAASAATLPAVVVEKLQSFLRDSAAAYRPLPAGI
jgi:hypothetical protein